MAILCGGLGQNREERGREIPDFIERKRERKKKGERRSKEEQSISKEHSPVSSYSCYFLVFKVSRA